MDRELRRLLEEQFKRKGRSMASVAEALGKTRAWLQRLIAGTRPISLVHLESILGELGVNPDEFFAEYLQCLNSPQLAFKTSLDENPILLLRAMRGGSDPSLGWISAFLGIAISPASERTSIHPRVRRIDDAREYDRQAALVESESWLRSFLQRSQQRRLSSKETSHLCTAIGAWSSIQRATGHQALGIKSLELAWQLHGLAPSAPSSGDLLERTGMVTLQLGYPLIGHSLMQRALGIAYLWEDGYRQTKSLLGIGFLAQDSGEKDVAIQAYRLALHHPDADDLRRAAAASSIALIHEQSGQLKAAIQSLSGLEESAERLPQSAQLSLFAIRARILKQLGQLSAARKIYDRLMILAQPLLSPIDRASLLLHLAEVLLELGDYEALRCCAPHVSALVDELEDSPLARDLMSTLLVTLQRGDQLALPWIREIQQQLV